MNRHPQELEIRHINKIKKEVYIKCEELENCVNFTSNYKSTSANGIVNESDFFPSIKSEQQENDSIDLKLQNDNYASAENILNNTETPTSSLVKVESNDNIEKNTEINNIKYEVGEEELIIKEEYSSDVENKFEDPINILNHQPKASTFVCSYRDYEANSISKLNNHLVAHKTDLPNLDCDHRSSTFNCSNPPTSQCGHCDYTTKKKTSLAKHLLKHQEKEVFYYCTDCEFKSKWRKSLTNHLVTHQTNPPTFDCSRCSYKSIKKSNLRNHVRTVHMNNVFNCTQCDYTAKQSRCLRAHILNRHSLDRAKKTVICYHCNNHFQSKITLACHMKMHDVNAPTLQCSQCDYTTKNINNFKHHTTRSHLIPIATYECKLCDYKGEKKANLRNHERRNHFTCPTFSCYLCDYSTICKGNLAIHVKIHQEKTVQGCKHCDKTFKTLKSLTRHVNTVHLKNSVTFVCTQCPYATQIKYSLKRHILTHKSSKKSE